MSHRQAFAWIDDWYGMTMEDVREYEAKMQDETNERLRQEGNDDGAKTSLARSMSVMEPGAQDAVDGGARASAASEPSTPTEQPKKGWFSSWY